MDNGWAEWKNHVLIEMKRLADNQAELNKEVATLKAKAAAWGAVSAFLVASSVNLFVAYMK